MYNTYTVSENTAFICRFRFGPLSHMIHSDRTKTHTLGSTPNNVHMSETHMSTDYYANIWFTNNIPTRQFTYETMPICQFYDWLTVDVSVNEFYANFHVESQHILTSQKIQHLLLKFICLYTRDLKSIVKISCKLLSLSLSESERLHHHMP